MMLLSARSLTIAFLAILLPAAAASGAGRPDLLTLFGDFQAWQKGLGADYRPEAVARQVAALATLQQRHAAIAVKDWSREDKVDWLVVRSEMDRAEFTMKVTRPWARDPGFVLEPVQRLAFASLPDAGMAARLKAVPGQLAAARATLDDMAADHADLALRTLVQSDGVEDGYPYRKVPPAGVIGWYRDLRARAAIAQPELLPDIDAALVALEAYRGWLTAARPRIRARAGVGKARLDWYLMHALQMPYDSEAALTLGQRELDRMWALLAIEQHRNRALPPLRLAADDAEYRARVADTDIRIRRFLVEKEFMTIPPGVPAELAGMAVPPTYLEPLYGRTLAGKSESGAIAALVACTHVSGLLLRPAAAGLDGVRGPGPYR